MPRETSVFKFLFRLTAEADSMPRSQFLRRLVTGLANHYGAAACSIYLDSPDGLLAAADPSVELEDLAESQQQSIRSIERELVVRAFNSGDYVSGVDVEADLPVDWDVFAFPRNTSRGTRAVAVIFLDANSRALAESDLQALHALGEVLEAAADHDLD